MNALEQKTEPVSSALDLLSQTQDQANVDKGYKQLKELADSGDMTAAAYLGYASQFEHVGHYDLEVCRKYLQMSADAGNPTGQYYLGMMLFMGEKPFQEDKVYGKWLLDQADRVGVREARRFMKGIYCEPSSKEAHKMLFKASLALLWEKIKDPFRKK